MNIGKYSFLVLMALVSSVSFTLADDTRFNRGLDIDGAFVFVPKGYWAAGATFSYSDYTFDNYKILVLDDFVGQGYTMKVSPQVSYFIANNTSIGALFTYSRTFIDLNSISLNLGDDLNFGINDYFHLEHSYYAALTYRNYISIANSTRFGFFNEMRLANSLGQGKTVSGTGSNLDGIYKSSYRLEIGAVPGLTAFVTNHMAVEVSVSVLGFYYESTKQIANQIDQASFQTSGVSFKIDLLSVNLGATLYLDGFNHKKK